MRYKSGRAMRAEAARDLGTQEGTDKHGKTRARRRAATTREIEDAPFVDQHLLLRVYMPVSRSLKLSRGSVHCSLTLLSDRPSRSYNIWYRL